MAIHEKDSEILMRKFSVMLIIRQIFQSLFCVVYHIRTNIDRELNLTNWRIFNRPPNLNLINIFLYHFTCDPSHFWWHLLSLTTIGNSIT